MTRKHRPNPKQAEHDAEAAAALEQARAAAADGKLAEAMALYERVTELQPDTGTWWRELGRVAFDLGRLTRARSALVRAAGLDRRDTGTHMMLARTHQMLGEAEQAAREFEHAAWLEPGEIAAHRGAAVVHEQLNNLDKAQAAIRRALEQDPTDPLSQVLVARLHRRCGDCSAAVETLARLLQRDIASEERLHAIYEQSRVLDRLKLYDKAFEAAAQGNALQREMPEAKAAYTLNFLGLMQQQHDLTHADFEAFHDASRPDDGPPPIFLVGFPRSGTTMTEQILAAHPNLAVSSERNLLSPALATIMKQIPRESSLGDMLSGVTFEQVTAARARYRELGAELIAREKGATRLVDKNPMQLGMLSFINRIFPESPVVVIHRDPRDVCLSCFVQEFRVNKGMVHFLDLEDTARMYETMMSLWFHQKDLLTLDILEIRYEDLTARFEDVVRPMVDHIGEEWDRDLLSFYLDKHRRYVSTPSYEAVTEPVHTKAQGKWLRHAEALAPILPRLEPFVKALGYTPTAEALAARP